MNKLAFSGVVLVFSASLFAQGLETSSSTLEAKKSALYSAHDEVLFNLDSGMLRFYEGDNEGAIERLTSAENGIFENYTKSVSQYAASFATNDSAIDYAGEDYEDMYTNLFKSIAYCNLGKRNDAIVEVNRFINKSKEISARHEAQLVEARKLVRENGSAEVNINFHDSALGEYLSLLYYRSIGDISMVQSSARFVNDAFATQSAVYDFPVPQSVKEETAVKKDDARLNFVCFSGLSPAKVEDFVRYSNELSVAVPALQKYTQNVHFVSVKAVNAYTGRVYTANLEKIEDISNVAMETFQANSALYYYKSLYRSLAKGSVTLGSRAAGGILAETDSALVSAAGMALSAGSVLNENVANSTERADLRLSKYFPARADIGGITVESGTYDIEISYYNKKGGTCLFTQNVRGVRAVDGGLNLVSASSTASEIRSGLISFGESDASKNRFSAMENENSLHFDLGTEPEKSGNISYGMIQYDWTKNFASRLDLRYSTKTEVENEIEGYGNAIDTTKTRTFEVDLLPFVKYFGRAENGRLFSVSAGFSYQYTYEKEFAGMFDVNGYMLDVGDEGKYFTMDDEKNAHFFSPKIGFTAKYPLASSFCLNFEGFINPFYCMALNQNMSYHSDQTATPFDYSGKNSVTRFSSPFIEVKLSFDMFRFLRLMTRLSYQRLNFQQMAWNANFDGLEGKDDVQTITKWRFGIEILSVNRKYARIRGGIYREQNWNNSSYLEKTNADGKWVFCIGTEF